MGASEPNGSIPYHDVNPPAEKLAKVAKKEWPFRLTERGVEKRIEARDKELGITTVEWRWFCSRLEVSAETRSSEGEEWGRLLSVTDRDGRVKTWAMPMSMLAGDGTAYRERLLSLGLIMAPGKFARDALHEYISTAQPGDKARCVGRLGWELETFVLPNGAIGDHSNG
ncbi:hypothetical protein C4E04_19095 [Microvirga sp. 17 mud 1-3]|nr:hypothetical protein C4E04_19095 [Microvirga sp. 17 mud 1-3]